MLLALLITLVVLAKPVWAGLVPVPDHSKVNRQVGECAVRQKALYEWWRAFAQKHGRPPENVEELTAALPESEPFIHCPLGPAYRLHPENFGASNAVFIEDSENAHSNIFAYWIRDIHPEVKTMGDGEIHLFRDGKLLVIHISADQPRSGGGGSAL